LDIRISDALRLTFQKEYQRQMKVYGKLKFVDQKDT